MLVFDHGHIIVLLTSILSRSLETNAEKMYFARYYDSEKFLWEQMQKLLIGQISLSLDEFLGKG